LSSSSDLALYLCLAFDLLLEFLFVRFFSFSFLSCYFVCVPWLIHKAKTEEPKTVLQQCQTGLTGGSDWFDRWVPV
jgi:hypothetical protein